MSAKEMNQKFAIGESVRVSGLSVVVLQRHERSTGEIALWSNLRHRSWRVTAVCPWSF